MSGLLAALLLAVGVATPSLAGDFYATGDLAISGMFAEVGGTPVFGPSFSDNDQDEAPAFGLALGFGAPLDYLIPWQPELPRWMPFEVGMPHWDLRSDIEIIGGSDFEFKTEGAADAYQTIVESWSLTWNFYLDMPLARPARKLFGRSPLFEKTTFDIGFGVGLGNSAARTDNNVESGSKEVYGFAYHVGASAAYRISDAVKLSFGYRYRDNPDVEIKTRDAADAPGTFDLEMNGHEFTTQIRWEFYWLPWPDRPDRAQRFRTASDT